MTLTFSFIFGFLLDFTVGAWYRIRNVIFDGESRNSRKNAGLVVWQMNIEYENKNKFGERL